MFKLIDRGQSRTLVLIAGWAFDPAVFSSLELPYNYLVWHGRAQTDYFANRLQETLIKVHLPKVALLGWSQGAYLAANFAKKNSGQIGRAHV